jgi:hypothetical protein
VAVKLYALALVTLVGVSRVAYAQAPEEPTELKTPSEVLRSSMDAATAGDWTRVAQMIETLLRGQLGQAELAEAHRLAGLAAFFQDRKPDAERHFLAYLQLDLDGQLDAALYPPDVIVFFTDVKTKYSAELRARRPKPKRYWPVAAIPPFAQFQNGDRTKGLIIGGGILALALTNVVTYSLLSSWCSEDRTCEANGRDRTSAAAKARVVNLASGIGLILTFAYGVYDGVSGYRRDTRERAQPYVSSTGNDAFIGVAGAF